MKTAEYFKGSRLTSSGVEKFIELLNNESHEINRLNEQIGELGKGYKFVCKMYYPYGLSCYDNFYTKEELTSELKELVEKVKLQEDNLQSKLTEVKKLAYQIFAGYKIRKFLKQL